MCGTIIDWVVLIIIIIPFCHPTMCSACSNHTIHILKKIRTPTTSDMGICYCRPSIIAHLFLPSDKKKRKNAQQYILIPPNHAETAAVHLGKCVMGIKPPRHDTGPTTECQRPPDVYLATNLTPRGRVRTTSFEKMVDEHCCVRYEYN